MHISQKIKTVDKPKNKSINIYNHDIWIQKSWKVRSYLKNQILNFSKFNDIKKAYILILTMYIYIYFSQQF